MQHLGHAIRLSLPMVAIATCIGACVSPATLRDQQSRAAFDSVKAYCDEMFSDAALLPIAQKTDVKSGNYSFQMLADETRVTESEKQAVALLGEKALRCQDRYVAEMRKYVSPLLVTNRQSYYAAVDTLRVDLFSGKLTWGQYHQARKKLLVDVQKAHAEIAAALDRQDQQLALARQQAAATDYANFLQSQRNQLLLSPPVTPTRPVNCTSQTIAGVTHTNCN